MYGGKIDDEEDFATLSSLVNNFLSPQAFEDECDIIANIQPAGDAGKDTLLLPTGIGWKDFTEWVDKLPEREPPTYLGLPANAEKLLLVNQAKEMIGKLSVVMGILEEGDRVMEEIVEG
jgi:dynein heavy chain 1